MNKTKIEEKRYVLLFGSILAILFISQFILFILAGSSSLNVFDSCKAIEDSIDIDNFRKVTQAGLYGFITCFLSVVFFRTYLNIFGDESFFCSISEFIISVSLTLVGIFTLLIFIGQFKAVSVVKNCNVENADNNELSKFMSDANTVNRLFGITIYFLGILATIIGLVLIYKIFEIFFKNKKLQG